MVLRHSDGEAVGKGDDHPILLQPSSTYAIERSVPMVGESKSVFALKVLYLSIPGGRTDNRVSIEAVAGPVVVRHG